MSFSVKTKNEMCRLPFGRPCCQLAEAYGMLLFAGLFSHREIKLTTEIPAVATRTAALIERAFGVTTPVIRSGVKRVIDITDERALRRILGFLGYDYRNYVTYHLNRNVIESDCCAAAFLRGVFLYGGTVAGPDKKSHLEIKTGHQSLCREVMSLMLDLRFSPKTTSRGTASLIYFKDTGAIEDLLTLVGATRAAMEMMEAKVEKNLRNHINRQVNCETANLMKTTDTSANQIAAIERALVVGGIEYFPENLRETVDLRVAHPTASLSQLAAFFDPPITKSGLNHRLRKIMQLAEAVAVQEKGET